MCHAFVYIQSICIQSSLVVAEASQLAAAGKIAIAAGVGPIPLNLSKVCPNIFDL